MLIDDRQIHSLDVNKLINVIDKNGNIIEDSNNKNSVVFSNSYDDLRDIPEEFNPSDHEHNLASDINDGFMSKEDFIKLHNLNYFNKINLEVKKDLAQYEFYGYIDKDDYFLYFKNNTQDITIERKRINANGFFSKESYDNQLIKNPNFLEDINKIEYLYIKGNIFDKDSLDSLLDMYEGNFNILKKDTLLTKITGNFNNYPDGYNWLKEHFPNIFIGSEIRYFINNCNNVNLSYVSSLKAQKLLNNLFIINADTDNNICTLSGYITQNDYKELNKTDNGKLILQSIYRVCNSNDGSEFDIALTENLYRELIAYDSKIFSNFTFSQSYIFEGYISKTLYDELTTNENIYWKNIINDLDIDESKVFYYIDSEINLSDIETNFDKTKFEYLNIEEKYLVSGYISRELYDNINGTDAFKNISLLNQMYNTTEKNIESTQLNDILKITSDKNINLEYNEESNTLNISINYDIIEKNLKGKRGDKGETGKRGITYLPSVDINGNLTFYKIEEDDEYIESNSVNIKGDKGSSGRNGVDATSTNWFDIKNKPVGDNGEVLYTGSNDKFYSDKILYTGFFPNSKEEFDTYKELLTLSFVENKIKEDFIEMETDIDTSITSIRNVNKFSLENNIFSINENNTSNNLISLLNPVNSYKYNFTIPTKNIILNKVFSIILSAFKDSEGNYNTLSLNFIKHIDTWNILNEDNFYNVALVLNVGTSNEIVLETWIINNLIDSNGRFINNISVVKDYDSNNEVYLEITGLTINQDISKNLGLINLTYNDNKLIITLNGNYLESFSNKTTFGIGCYKKQTLELNNILPFYINKNSYFSIYPIYDYTLNRTYSFSLNEDNSNDVKLYDGEGIVKYVKPGHFIKDINSKKVYYFSNESNIIELN